MHTKTKLSTLKTTPQTISRCAHTWVYQLSFNLVPDCDITHKPSSIVTMTTVTTVSRLWHANQVSYIGCFFHTWTISAGPTVQWVLLDYYHCDRWSSAHYRLFNLPRHAAERRAERWAGTFLSRRKKERPISTAVALHRETDQLYDRINVILKR
jgi:hypothetical protein